ncbi:MAG: peptide ABC transporter substrate-binding protein [Chloroflexi bacterium]|nr:peptide ABC transporter substrate-binding protein [Chloroflexota bacterium]
MKKTFIPFLLALVLLLAPACLIAPSQTDTPTPPAAQPTSSPTLALEDEQTRLTVCMGQEPNSLYPFGELNTAARNVLSAINDGPIDTVSYEYLPVILTQLPSFENGDAQIIRSAVNNGDPVVDSQGNLTTLQTGLRVRPAGCTSDDCAITYDGASPLQMDQMIVTFRLRPGLTWSDGTPLTAEDSLYAFELHRQANINSYLINRTQAYEAADEQTLQWFGIAGFTDPTYFLNIWQPAPRHAWSEFPADQLPKVDISSRTPLSWGPFAIKEWTPGESILLEKNPYYYRIRDGFPRVDTVLIRFIPDPNLALSELIAGRCDLIDPTINLEDHVGLLQEMQTAGQAQMFVTTGMSMEWLGLGVVPASYENGYDIQKDRQDIFGDQYTRQAIAYCLDRETITANVLYGLTGIPTSYLPSNHPAFDSNIQVVPFDPEIGISLLEQAGWLDTDNDPSTPRRAINTQNVAYNTPLILKYQTTSTAQRRQVAAIIERSLSECGIGLDVEFLPPNDLYAPGPGGPLFGRQFDLAQYALGAEGIEPPCNWFNSAGIPTEENSWAGANITGFRNDEYDTACLLAQSSQQKDAAQLASYRQTQIILAEELPAIPLYSRLRIAAASPPVCGLDLDPTASLLANIEAYGIGETCQN